MSVLLVLSLTAFARISAGYEFSQVYRISAGSPISLRKLHLGADVEIKDVFIGRSSVDYGYCDEYERETLFDFYLTKLNIDLEECLRAKDCAEIDWLSEDLMEVKCNNSNARTTYATAINLLCNYKIADGAKYINSLNSKGLLPFEANSIHKACGASSVANISSLLPVGYGNSSIVARSTHKVLMTLQLIGKLVQSCTVPCKAFSLSQAGDYGYTFVSGLNRTKDLAFTASLDEMILLYSCVNKEDIGTDSTNESSTQDGLMCNSAWMYAAIACIILSVILVATAVVFIRVWSQRKDTSTNFNALEANNNSKTSMQRSKADSSTRPYSSPYTLPNSARGTGKLAFSEPAYTDLVDPDSDHHYEPVIPKVARSNGQSQLKNKVFKNVDQIKEDNRMSAGSYIDFDAQ